MVSAIVQYMLTTDPSASGQIIRGEVDRLLRDVLHLRGLASPVIGLVLLYAAWVDDVPWRRAALLGVMVVGFAGVIAWARRARNQEVAAYELRASLLASGPLQLVGITLTGGLDSPILPFLPPFISFASLLLGWGAWLRALLAIELVWVAALAVVQGFGWAPQLSMSALGTADPQHFLWMGLGVAPAIVACAIGGLAVRARLYTMVESGLKARHRELDLLRTRSREMELIGGELAHELKNPLASIHGLAALVGRNLTSERDQERMSVLQGEVHRMTTIVEEFRSFARPIAPLGRVTVDVTELLARMQTLYEPTATLQGVQLSSRAGAASVVADQLKVEQILVNLVQNALHAAPRGSTIELDAHSHGSGMAITVADRGPGVPPELAARVFEAGVTTRSEGSGLGLSVARMLARQHGGDLTLEERPGGGTVARLVLA